MFTIENNQFGMGTSAWRASKNTEFYTRGDYIPGVWVDGMDALAVKSASAFAKQHALERGPIILEMVRILFEKRLSSPEMSLHDGMRIPCSSCAT